MEKRLLAMHSTCKQIFNNIEEVLDWHSEYGTNNGEVQPLFREKIFSHTFYRTFGVHEIKACAWVQLEK